MVQNTDPVLFDLEPSVPVPTGEGLALADSDMAEMTPVGERLRTLLMEDGFVPGTRGELNEAYSLKGFIEMPGGTARHLAEVAIHQGKHKADPARATASITRDYIQYAQGARNSLTTLSTLSEELDDMRDENPLAAVDGSRLHTGLGLLVRSMDLRELARTDDFSKFPFSPLRPYSNALPRTYDPYAQTDPNPEVQARIQDVIARTRVWEARREVTTAMKEQRARNHFWVARISEINKHSTGPLRTIAREALLTLGVKPEYV